MARATRSKPSSDLLDVDQAVKMLKTSRPTFYRWLRSGQIKGLRTGRKWRFEPEELRRFMTGEQPPMDLPPAAGELTRILAARLKQLGVQEIEPEQISAPPAMARLICLLLRVGAALRASDLHIEPVAADGGLRMRIRHRVDGVLHELASVDARLLAPLVETLKRIGQCDPNQKEIPQDCRLIITTDRPPEELKSIDVRVCFLPTHLGESVTMRFLVRKEYSFKLDEYGYGSADLQRIKDALQLPWGLLLMVGPTGSGKTTLLYGALLQVANMQTKVLSIEDPVEYQLPNVTQVQINPKANMTFARAMRAAIRSDPDVIMVGEIRDAEVMNICCQAALTGHLVLTTLHTDTAVAAIHRLINIGLEPFLASDTVKLIVAQRLVRKLCPHCSRKAMPGANLMQEAEIRGRVGGLDLQQLPRDYRESKGCTKCGNTGFRGRRPIIECLQVSAELAAAIRRGAGEKELMAIAVGQGMTSMAADGIRRAAEGEVLLEEVLQTAPRMPL